MNAIIYFYKCSNCKSVFARVETLEHIVFCSGDCRISYYFKIIKDRKRKVT